MKDFLFGVACIAVILFAYGLAAHLDEKDEIAYRIHQIETTCKETEVRFIKERPRFMIIGCENKHD